MKDYIPLKKNRLKELIEKKELAIGSAVHSHNPMIVQLAGVAGLDFVYLDFEHQSLNWETFGNLIMACDSVDVSMTARFDPAYGIDWICRYALELGCMGLQFGRVDTKEDVERIVAAAKFPPSGNRGSGNAYWRRFGSVPVDEYAEWSNRETVIIVLIESKEAMENIEEICSVKGVDAVIFGPHDYALSVGLNMSQTSDPGVVRARRRMVEVALDKGVAPYMGVRSVEEAREWIDRGCRIIRIAEELDILLKAWRGFMKLKSK